MDATAPYSPPTATSTSWTARLDRPRTYIAVGAASAAIALLIYKCWVNPVPDTESGDGLGTALMLCYFACGLGTAWSMDALRGDHPLWRRTLLALALPAALMGGW